MIRNTLLSFAALAVFALPAAAQQAKPLKIAYINSQKIIAEAPGAKEAQAAFEKQMGEYRTELQKLQTEIQGMVEDYQKKEAMLSAQAKQQQQEAIRQKQQDYQQRAQELEQAAGQKQQELVKPIMDKIETVITALRKEQGYDLIFDSAAGGLIAADPALDITDEVLARLTKLASTSPSPK